MLKAQRAILPQHVPIFVVGGVKPAAMSQWSGIADGFGLGSALYKPGMTPAEVKASAQGFFG